ncbi:50S ribosomal protein L15 [Gimesia sp.]|uniref:50S ribosomal protein L15 n=1 Tax=Gimesia sp. TaxID=2024833 RepID=UPI003A95B80F
MIIDDVHRGIQKNKKKKRVGRGPGSGHGKTSSRGHKGYGSRAGSSRRTSFEGGQTPLAMRVAKRGFNNKQFAKKVAVVNVAALEQAFDAGAEITPEVLAEKGLAKGRFDQVKILGNGDLTKKFTVSAHLFSASAESKIQAAGGSVSRVLS